MTAINPPPVITPSPSTETVTQPEPPVDDAPSPEPVPEQPLPEQELAAEQPAAESNEESSAPPAPDAETETSEQAVDSGDGEGEQGQEPVAEEGPPAPPPGPSAAELQLLGEYGDGARKRIRSQARNPEQGGEGTVTFEFEVARDGHLIDVWIARTSGYANMDNDTLEATRAAFNERHEKIPFPPDVKVASWTFVMSIKYPLY